MTTPEAVREVVHVRHNRGGWWDVTTQAGAVLAQFTTEFQARESGRVNARRLRADLAIHQPPGPTLYWVYDDEKDTMKPLVATPAAHPSGEGTPALPAAERKPLVLLVEDLVDSRELYAQYLTYAGFSVVTAINGHEALRLAQLLRPDIVLMDVRLPGMDGLEATADLKRIPELQHIPVVAITADSSQQMAERCRAAGCAAFISKPALPDEVARELKVVLSSVEGSETR